MRHSTSPVSFARNLQDCQISDLGYDSDNILGGQNVEVTLFSMLAWKLQQDMFRVG